jgi:hypothetical protein
VNAPGIVADGQRARVINVPHYVKQHQTLLRTHGCLISEQSKDVFGDLRKCLLQAQLIQEYDVAKFWHVPQPEAEAQAQSTNTDESETESESEFALWKRMRKVIKAEIYINRDRYQTELKHRDVIRHECERERGPEMAQLDEYVQQSYLYSVLPLFGAQAQAKVEQIPENGVFEDDESETIDEIQSRVKEALNHIKKENLIAAPDCGLGHLPRQLAKEKLITMVNAVKNF